MRAYLHDNIPGNITAPHDSGVPISIDQLAAIGVLYWHIPIQNWEVDVNKIAAERGYKNRDTVENSKELLGDDFEKRNGAFFAEYVILISLTPFLRGSPNFPHRHMHEAEEIRYSLKGGGYFDVRGTFSSGSYTSLLQSHFYTLQNSRPTLTFAST